MAKKIGTLIKEARTGAGLTQEALAKKVDGVTASDISKAERNEKELTQAQLKQIAKACGVTQSSLLNAGKETTAKKTTKKTVPVSEKKITSASEKKTTTKKTTSSSSSASSSMKLTAAEKKLVELYRKATKEQKEEAIKALSDDDDPDLLDLLGGLLEKIF